MPCPHASPEVLSALSRRDFLKSALAIGGGGALSACVDRRGTPDVPRGPSNPSRLPDRQFAWNQFLPRDAHGNVDLPEHQLLLFFDYAGDGVPTDAEREQVEATLRDLERAYQPGNGGANPYSSAGREAPGLLFTVGYAPSYFDRYEGDLPVPLPRPADTLDRIDEPTDRAASHEVGMVLVSDHVQVLLAAEEALRGNLDSVNGVGTSASFEGILERVERRTGFIGPGLPDERLDTDDVPESSPLSMGFKSNYRDGQATEDRVTIQSGPFAGGTTQHVSRLELDLDRWYDNPDDQRREQMFSPHHSAEEVGEVGRQLAGDSGVTRETVDRTEADAEEYGVVGHSQKVAAARDDNFEPTMLRRSEGVSTDAETPGFNFTALQRRIERFVEVRQAMNESYGVADDDDGIRGYIEATSRTNLLIPPRELRALPPADPSA
ncbi:DUF7405 family protein [Halorientalis litorea]|uniref:DUF7405 family protein n=1 Tax=Halorientalis litorea TaxID=2931977 RepID=UPI001FF33321|nr:twin-arginine translocation signal domain-containing protein [Halorientalis litorea]